MKNARSENMVLCRGTCMFRNIQLNADPSSIVPHGPPKANMTAIIASVTML